MSICECNRDYLKEIESNTVKIFSLQGLCLKCGVTFSSKKTVPRGVGFAKWCLSVFKANSAKQKQENKE